MTEDGGYETIVPDLTVVDPSGDPVPGASVSEIWRAAYNQALKDAAEVVMRAKTFSLIEDTAKEILSLGDKGNG